MISLFRAHLDHRQNVWKALIHRLLLCAHIRRCGVRHVSLISPSDVHPAILREGRRHHMVLL